MQYSLRPGQPGSRGDSEWSQEGGEALVKKLAETGAETVVFRCPTCACHIKYRFKDFMDGLPFRNISFGRYVLEHIGSLSFPEAKPCRVTLHEPCKTAYMGIDLEEIREILRAIPGTELVEMAHHHAGTMCCGCRAAIPCPRWGTP
jgi:Fe-S oxidoreductase